MAFGMFSPDINDSFDTGKVVGAGAKDRAQDFLNKYIETDIVGGAAVNTVGQTRAKELLGDAQQSAQSTANNANLISGGLDLIGSVGSFGAAGGFGKTTDFSQPVFGSPGARETIGGYDSFETFNPSKIPGLTIPSPLR